MPELQTTGESSTDLRLVRAAMHWPGAEEEVQRRQFYVAEYVNSGAFEPGVTSLNLPVQALQTLLFAPSWPVLVREVSDRTRLGIQAGDILLFMFLFDRLKDRLPARGAQGASLDKAFGIAKAWAEKGATWGDGEARAKSTTKIKEAWSAYRGVAHLWAALTMNLVFPYAPAKQVFHTDHFSKFLETAAYLQCFALEHKLVNKAKQSEASLVAEPDLWKLDLNRHRPRMLFPTDLSAFDDAPFLELLKAYASKKR